jgi:hypothetical protein
LNGRQLPDRFETPGELVCIVRDDDQAGSMLMRAVAGRVVRSMRRCDDGVMAALEAAAVQVGASVRLDALDAPGPAPATPASPAPERFLVSIRPEDRERFDETIHPARSRWVGETEAVPGIRAVCGQFVFPMDFHAVWPYTSLQSRG